MKKIAAVITAASMLFASVSAVTFAEKKEETPKIKNIIYMIPDGGGLVPLKLANYIKKAGGLSDRSIFPYVTQTGEGELFEKSGIVGAVTTYCADAEVTDSAAAGTAMATGYKANTGNIGIDANLVPKATLLEACQLLGKKTGMVTTYDWANATPAAFSSHDISRSNNGILSEQITNQGIDVVLGVGYNMAGWGSLDEAIKRGYTVVNNRSELNQVKQGDKIWGNLEDREFPYDINNTADTVHLDEMTKAAITALSDSDEDGFFLMVEGSRIDGAGHANNAQCMAGDYLAFDEAVGVALEYAKERDDTIVIACADHDTGGMTLPNDETQIDSIVNEIRAGKFNPEGITWEGGTHHTNLNVGLFLYAPEGTVFPDGINPDAENPTEENIIDNTEIAPYLASLMGIDLDEAAKQLFVDVTDMGKYDPAMRLFIFENYPVSVTRNASYAFIGDKVVDLDGQVCIYVEGKFYVPQLLLDIMNGQEAKEYETIPMLPKIQCSLKSVDDIEVKMSIKNYFRDKELNGYIKFNAPDNFAALGKIDFGTITGDEEKTINIDCNDIDKNGCDFSYDIVLDDGKTYSFEEKFNGIFYGAYTNKPIKVDGIIDEAEWDRAPKIVCDDVSMIVDKPNWKGFRDLSAVFSVLYDEENLYFYATVTDEIFNQQKQPSNMWENDCIQFGFYNDTEGLFASKSAGSRYDGINFGFIEGEPIAFRSQRSTELVPKNVVMEQGDDIEFKCSHNLNDMTYEIRMTWDSLFGYKFTPYSGETLAFSFVANDDDGDDNRGAILYGNGIYGGKDVNKFIPIYLLDPMGEAKQTEEPEKINIFYNDQKLDFYGKPFMSLNGRTMVAAEEFFNAANISYTKGDTIVVDSCPEIDLKGGKEFADSDTVASNRGAILYMPIRAVCEKLGMDVLWEAETSSVFIK